MAPTRTALLAAAVAALAACDTPAGPDSGGCSMDTEGGLTLAMNVGDVATVSSPAELACLRVAAADQASTYLFVPANVTERQDVRIGYTLKTSRSGQSATASVAASLGAAGRTAPFPVRDTRIDERIRAFERTLDPRRALPNRRGATTKRGALAAVAAAPPTVGTTKTIRVPNFNDATDQTLCDNAISVTATVKAVGENSVILVDNASPTGGLTDADFVAIAAEFDTLIYKVDTLHFGVPTDLDVDGRIYILYTPEVNKLSEPNSGSYVGGYFFSGDLFDIQDCAQSNETEIFYLLAADPLGDFGNAFSSHTVRVSTRGTIAHEFQHMINLGVKIAAPFVANDETVWLNEGLSHFAEELVGRKVLGRSDMDELTWGEVWADEDTYIAYFYQNFARFESYLRNPAGSSATSKNADSQLSYRGAAWAFVRYLADHYSGGDVAAFTRGLILTPDTGIANIENETGVEFEQQLRGWLIANYADDRPITNLDPLYEYASWRMREAMGCFVTDSPTGACGSPYPLKTTELSAVPSAGASLSILTGSGAYYTGTFSSTTPDFWVRLLGTNGRLVSAPGARMFVLRTN